MASLISGIRPAPSRTRRVLKAAVFDESTPFHATLEELANDRERLLP
jgi:uncharacterized membrane protein YqjE